MSLSPAQPPAADTEAPVHPGRMQRLAAIAQCLLQHLDTPLLVLDAQGSLLEASSAALGRLERCDGLWRDAAGRLALRQGGRWVPVTRWYPQIAAGHGVVLPLDAQGAPMQIKLETMPSGGGWVLATIERVALVRGDAMRRRFRFTRTQARLAEMLCQGMRPAHAAEALGVKISTVRTHVGVMYEKTGAHSQAELVALLHAS